MKKLISILLTVVLLAVNFQIVFSAENLDISFDIYESSTEKTVILNSNIATSDYDLYIAAYKGKKLQALEKITMDLTYGYNRVDTGLDWDDLDKDYVKIFVWEEGLRIHSEKYGYDVLRPAVSTLSTFIVTKNTLITYNGEDAYMLNGVLEGKSTRVIVYNEKGYGDQHPESLVADDVILIAQPDAKSVVSYIEKIETTKYRGVLENSPLTFMAGGTYEPYRTPMLNLAKTEEYVYSDDGTATWQPCGYYNNYNEFVYESVVAVASKIDADKYLGKAVIMYAGEDKETGKFTTYAIMEDGTKNSTLKINSSQLVKMGEKYSGYRWDKSKGDYVEFEDDYGTIGYRETGSNTIKGISLENHVAIYENYDYNYYTAYDRDYDYDVYGFATQFINEFFEWNGYGGTVEFISNDADSEYDAIFVTAYQDESVVEAVTEEKGILVYDHYKGAFPEEIDPEDDTVLNIIIKDGEVATASDITEFDTVSYVEVADGLNMYYVSSKVVEGTVESYDEDNNKVTIGGVDYEVSVAHKYYGATAKLAGEKGKFFINVNGQISHSETEPVDNGNYALVTGAYKAANGFDIGTYLQVVLADGTLAEYKISDTAKLYNADRNVEVVNDSYNKEAIYDHYTGLLSVNDPVDTPDLYQATVEDLMDNSDLFVRIAVNNNKITTIRRLEGNTKSVTDETKKYDAEANSIGNVDFAEDTVVFAVKQTEWDELVDAETVVIGSLSDFFDDQKPIRGMIVAADEDEDDSVYSAAIGFGIGKTIDATSDLFVVTGKTTTSINGRDAYIFTGMQAGEEKTITVYNKNYDYITNPEDVTIGDMLLIMEEDKNGYINNIEMIVDYEYDRDIKEHDFDVYPSKTAIDDDEIFSGFGEVCYASDNKFAIDGDIQADYDDLFDISHYDNIPACAELAYRSSATYTLVDFTESATNPAVSVEAGDKSLFNSDKYNSFAYVRYVGGIMKEVVVFRMAEIPGYVEPEEDPEEEPVVKEGDYALILGTYKKTNSISGGTYLQVVLADGTLAEYKLSNTAKMYDEDGSVVCENSKEDKETIYYYYTDLMSANNGYDIYQASVADLMDNSELFARIVINNDEITKINLLEGGRYSVTDETKEYDAEANSIGNVDFAEETVVFAVKQTEWDELVVAEDVVIGSLSDFFEDAKPIRGMVVATDEDDNSIYSATIGFGIGKTIDATSDLFVVTGKSTTTVNGNTAYVLTGMQAGEEKTITVYNTTDNYITDPEVVTVSDVLLIMEEDKDGYVNNIEIIVDHDYDRDIKEHGFDVFASSTAIDDDEIFTGFGEVIVSRDNKFAIDGDIVANYDDEFLSHEDNIPAGAELSYRSSATYTLVDFTQSATKPAVSVETGNKTLINMDNFDSFAYVRYVGGVMKEVLVFRMTDYR